MRVIVESFDKNSDYLKPKIKKLAKKIGSFLNIKNKAVEIFLVGNDFMKTNVLSFPAPKDFVRPDLKQKPLGEIYLNPGYIAKEAWKITPPAGGWRLEIPLPLAFMLIHGFLHLLGYDHIKKNDSIKMEKKERGLLEKVNNRHQ